MNNSVMDTLDALIPGAAKAAAEFELTDMGNAERMAHRHGDCIRYCFTWGKWLVWDGSRWREDNIGKVRQYAKDTVKAILDEANACADAATRAALSKHARASQSARRLALLREDRQIRRPPEPLPRRQARRRSAGSPGCEA